MRSSSSPTDLIHSCKPEPRLDLLTPADMMNHADNSLPFSSDYLDLISISLQEGDGGFSVVASLSDGDGLGLQRRRRRKQVVEGSLME
ncbi:hypothetical protein L2E82_31314 [Cichorium intybus]|uniref:Uncharacterized protein n=1 Tax=Cichorium intybus TaxID=13427 RepID=A0ACB9D318_CICIN|nr:hypothetical protein L2E82_31314 [Cichorium intybus]